MLREKTIVGEWEWEVNTHTGSGGDKDRDRIDKKKRMSR